MKKSLFFCLLFFCMLILYSCTEQKKPITPQPGSSEPTTNPSQPSTSTTPPVVIPEKYTIADFGSSLKDTRLEFRDWKTVIISPTASYSSTGIGITRISGATNFDNYILIKGSPHEFKQGDRITVKFYSISGQYYIRPLISFTDTDSPENKTGSPQWYAFNKGEEIPVSTSATYIEAYFDIKDYSHLPKITGTYSSINICFNNIRKEQLILDKIELTRSDTNPPSKPEILSCITTDNSVTLSWSASKDNSKIKKYWIYRDGKLIGSTYNYKDTTSTKYSDYLVRPSSTYRYSVSALDEYDNESEKSSEYTAITPAFSKNSSVINPENDLEYLGAFRLPAGSGNSNWGYGGNEDFAFYPDGDPSNIDGDSEFTGSIYGYGNFADGHQKVSEISIPKPIISPSKNISELNTAKTLQIFTNIFGFKITSSLSKAGLMYMPPQETQTTGKLYYSYFNNYQNSGKQVSFGRLDLNLSSQNNEGGWYVGDSTGYNGTPPYLTYNDILFKIPDKWALENSPGKLIAGAQYREGFGSGLGLNMFAIGPKADTGYNKPIPAKESLDYIPLIQYGSTEDKAMNGRVLGEAVYEGGDWIDFNGKSAVIFSVNKCIHEGYYGAGGIFGLGIGDGTRWTQIEYNIPLVNPDGLAKGWYATERRPMLVFYDPSDLADVAAGRKAAWEPQPYAFFDITDYFFKDNEGSSINKNKRIGALTVDNKKGYLYVAEYKGDNNSPLIHVFKIK